MTVTINAEFTNIVSRKITEMTSKCRNIPGAKLTTNVSNAYICTDPNSEWYRQNVIDVTVDADYRLGEWQFIANLEWNEEKGQNIITKCAEKEDVPSMYYTRRACDHCGQHKVKKFTILVRNIKTREYKQVGKGCLRNYIGYDFNGYLSLLTQFKNLQQFIDTYCQPKGVGNEKYYNTKAMLVQAIRIVERDGFDVYDTESMAKAVEMSGADLDHEPTMDEKLTAFVNYINKICNENNGNEYHNYGTLVNTTYLPLSQAKVLSEIYRFYVKSIKAEQETAERNRRNEELRAANKAIKSVNARIIPQSEYVGIIGEEIEIDNVTVTLTSRFTNQFGPQYVYEIMDGANVLKWFTSYEYKDGTYHFKGKVKAHKTNAYKRNRKETIVNYCHLTKVKANA